MINWCLEVYGTDSDLFLDAIVKSCDCFHPGEFFGGYFAVLGQLVKYGTSRIYFLQIIRYSFFGMKEGLGSAPSWLLWLRYM